SSDPTAYDVDGKAALFPTPKNKRGVDAAESKVVAHHKLMSHGSSLAPDVIQFGAVLIDVVEIESGGVPVVIHHMDRGPGFDGAASAESVPDVGLQRTDRHATTKHRLGGGTLGDVSPVGGRAVGIDVTDCRRLEFGVAKGPFHTDL